MATLDDVLAELQALRAEVLEWQQQLRKEMHDGHDELRQEVRDEGRQVRAETQEGFERLELKIQRVRSDIHQLDKDLVKHTEMHREVEAEIASLKKARAPRVTRATRARR
jgi:hypothetical protein